MGKLTILISHTFIGYILQNKDTCVGIMREYATVEEMLLSIDIEGILQHIDVVTIYSALTVLDLKLDLSDWCKDSKLPYKIIYGPFVDKWVEMDDIWVKTK